jgi:uncharacterized OB-fold protein
MRLLDANLVRETPEGWVLVAQKCRSCGRLAYPKKRFCPQCLGEDLAEQPLSRIGTLHTYTRTYVGPPRLGSPYTVGFVDLPEKIRVFAPIVEGDTELQVGQTMELVMDVLWREEGGEEVVSYKFRPLAQGRYR